MKMSEAFSLPLQATYEKDYSDEYNHHICDSTGDILLPCIPDDVDQELIVESVNNHDRMVEENKKLREFAMYCQGFLGCEESRDSIALHGITINAKDLLAKLNQGGEE